MNECRFSSQTEAWLDENKTKDNASWYYKLTFLYVYFIALWDTMTFIAFCRKPTILDVINSGTNFNLKGRNWVLEGKIIYKLVHEWSTNTLQNHDDKQVVNEIQSYYGLYYVPLLNLCFILYWVFVQFFYVAASKHLWEFMYIDEVINLMNTLCNLHSKEYQWTFWIHNSIASRSYGH